MAVKKTIAIIEHGTEAGPAVAKILARWDYRLLLLSDDTGDLAATPALLKKINPDAAVEIVQCQVDASWEADSIVLAVAMPGILQTIALKIKEVVTGKTVICIHDDRMIKNRMRELLPHSRIVVISFNELIQQADFQFDKLLEDLQQPVKIELKKSLIY